MAPWESPLLFVPELVGYRGTEDENAGSGGMEDVGGRVEVDTRPLDDVTVIVTVDVTVVVALAPTTMLDVTVDCTAVLLVEVTTVKTV